MEEYQFPFFFLLDSKGCLHFSHNVPVRIGAPHFAQDNRSLAYLGISKNSSLKKYSTESRGTPVSRAIVTAERAPFCSR